MDIIALTDMKEFFVTVNDSLKELFEEISSLDEEIRIILADGLHRGVDGGRLFFNIPVPLVIESESGEASKCILESENCEAFHKDTENRAVLTFGERCTSVILRNFTIENTHVKTCDDCALGNQAEAICFNCPGGKLFCQGMTFISRQDTIHVKGRSYFKSCFVSGDVDFIWGYCDTSVFENCHIHPRADNRGSDRPAYVLQSRALNSRPGFVFIGCDFTAEDRGQAASLYVARSQGTGRPDSPDRWDSVALIDCRLSDRYNPALWTDEGGSRLVYPEKGCALFGWRQYGTKILHDDGSLSFYDDSAQDGHGYTMSEYEKNHLISLIKE